jgi:N-acetylneuraminate synthase
MVGVSFFEAGDVLDFVENIEIFDFFKIPSVEVTNFALIDKLMSFNKYVLISTGTADEATLKYSLSSIKGNNWLPLHCISNYPTASFNSKLGYIQHLRNTWNRPVGYSSHDSNWSINCAAILLGAQVIERHITLNKKSKGLDHSSSSTSDEFELIIDFIRNKDRFLSGFEDRVPNQGELLNLQNLGRSFYAAKDMPAGSALLAKDFKYLSPKIGFGFELFSTIDTPVLVKDIKAGEALTPFYLKYRESLSEKAIEFSNSLKVGLPVRLHDFSKINNIFHLQNYEFHLSYGEIGKLKSTNNFNKNANYTIHLPDYSSANQLLDPFSADVSQKEKSIEIIRETLRFADKISGITGKQVGVVGSFSVISSTLEQFYLQYSNLLAENTSQNVNLAMQWLPPIAWYFGGSVELKVLNKFSDITFLLKHKIDIVMDTSHLFMGKNYYGFDELAIVEKLKSQIKWFHISGASGIDGEGRGFANLTDDERKLMINILKSNKIKIIEVWQGHLDNYFGFQNAIETLEREFNNG